MLTAHDAQCVQHRSFQNSPRDSSAVSFLSSLCFWAFSSLRGLPGFPFRAESLCPNGEDVLLPEAERGAVSSRKNAPGSAGDRRADPSLISISISRRGKFGRSSKKNPLKEPVVQQRQEGRSFHVPRERLSVETPGSPLSSRRTHFRAGILLETLSRLAGEHGLVRAGTAPGGRPRGTGGKGTTLRADPPSPCGICLVVACFHCPRDLKTRRGTVARKLSVAEDWPAARPALSGRVQEMWVDASGNRFRPPQPGQGAPGAGGEGRGAVCMGAAGPRAGGVTRRNPTRFKLDRSYF